MFKIHKINLLKTARALLLNTEHAIDMQSHALLLDPDEPGFVLGPAALFDRVTEKGSSCGTSTCFAGYGPVAGFEPTSDEGWHVYARRVFGVDGAKWSFLFSGYHDNCAKSCAVRALILTTKADQFAHLLAEDSEGRTDLDENARVREINDSYGEFYKQLGDGTDAGLLIPTADNLLRLLDEAIARFQKYAQGT